MIRHEDTPAGTLAFAALGALAFTFGTEVAWWLAARHLTWWTFGLAATGYLLAASAVQVSWRAWRKHRRARPAAPPRRRTADGPASRAWFSAHNHSPVVPCVEGLCPGYAAARAQEAP